MSKAWTLAKRPKGEVTMDNFALTEFADKSLTDGQIRVQNEWLSVDPYMRGRMVDRKSYVPPFQIGEPLQGGAIGRVIMSKNPDFA